MTNLASALKSEITRLARKESRSETAPVKKASNAHRSEIAALKRRLLALEQQVRQLARQAPQAKPSRESSDDAARPTRFRVQGLVALRKRLGLSAEDFGRLVGASGQSVYNWEHGVARPRAAALQRIISLRRVGKREVAEYLEKGRSPESGT